MCCSLNAQEQTLTVLLTHYPPFINEHDESKGLSWNLLRDFTSSKGVNVKSQYLPNARLLKQVSSGDWQATITHLPEHTEGRVSIIYAEEVINYGVLVKHNKPIVLEGLHVTAIRSGGLSEINDYLIKRGVEISTVNTLEQANLMYDAGRVDAILGVVMDGKTIGVKKAEEYVMAIKLAQMKFKLSFNKNNPQALAVYNQLMSASK
jgi:ABC-type amino acid transport substrate-binding protein